MCSKRSSGDVRNCLKSLPHHPPRRCHFCPVPGKCEACLPMEVACEELGREVPASVVFPRTCLLYTSPSPRD
eukprot:2293041-Alexandrium_andersonii.AAC.1